MYKCLLLFLMFSTCLPAFSQTLVIAHRGASAYKMENSIAAFEQAILMKADYIETDVHQTKDGAVVIMHDLSINRTCVTTSKDKKLIKDLSLKEFKSLQFKDASGSPPTLDSAIRFINGRCKLLIELKKGSDYYPEIEKHIIEIIRNNNAEKWVDVIHSFDKKTLMKVEEERSGIRLQKLIVFKLPLSSFVFSKKMNRDDFKNWHGVNIFRMFASKHLIRKLHKKNICVNVWTVNRRGKAQKLLARGADGIITNKPDMIRELIDNKAALELKDL